jgi:hypothetical protein
MRQARSRPAHAGRMALGPLELMVLSFPAQRLGDGIRATLDRLAVLLEHRWVHDLADRVAHSRGTVVSLKHITGIPFATHGSRIDTDGSRPGTRCVLPSSIGTVVRRR